MGIGEGMEREGWRLKMRKEEGLVGNQNWHMVHDHKGVGLGEGGGEIAR